MDTVVRKRGRPQGSKSSARPARRITRKQAAFIDEYLLDFNACRAAIAAGYANNGNAQQIGANLLNGKIFPHIRTTIETLLADRRKSYTIDSLSLVQELTLIGKSNVSDLYDSQGNLLSVEQLPDHVTRAVSEIKTEYQRTGTDDEGHAIYSPVTTYKFWSKLEAIRMLGQHIGTFKEAAAAAVNQVNVQVNTGAIDFEKLYADQRAAPDPIEVRLQAMDKPAATVKVITNALAEPATPAEAIPEAVPFDENEGIPATEQ